MFAKTVTSFRRLSLMVLLSLFSGLSLHGGPAAAQGRAPVCEPLVKQLRWHQPFFGIRTWWEVASEAMSHASVPCREAIAAGQAKEVAAALRSLDEHREAGGVPLRQFIYRLTCRLRVPEASAQILAGVREAGVYAECADALFAMESSDPEAVALRALYLEGLRREPLTTPLLRSLLRPPYVTQLAPVLRAYDEARRPRRDTLYRALCLPSPADSVEALAVCTGQSEREPQWAREKLLRGETEAGLSYIAAMQPEQLAQLTPLLQQFNSEQRRGRDRLYSMLCNRPIAPVGELAATCRALVPNAESSWAPLQQKRLAEQQLDADAQAYYLGGRYIGLILLSLSLLIGAHSLLFARRRAQLTGLRAPTS